MVRPLTAAAIAVLTLLPLPTEAQRVSGGGANGTIISASALRSGGPVTILTTPANGHFILTTFCAVGGSATLSGSTFGPIVSTTGCEHFSPGVAIPSNEDLVCDTGGANLQCLVSGVLSGR